MNDHGNDPLGANDARNTSQPTELSELITRAKKYMTARFGHFLNDAQMFEMWQLTLYRIEELSSFGDPAFSAERFVADTIPGMLIKHWIDKYADSVLLPGRKFLKRSGIPWDSADISEVETYVWGLLIPQWFRDGKVLCLGRPIPIAALKGLRIEDIRECACFPICKCPRNAPMSFQRALYELTKHATGAWRTKHRSRNQDADNAAAKAKREAAKAGVEYVEPPTVALQDVEPTVWGVSKQRAIGYTGMLPDDYDYAERHDEELDDLQGEPQVARTKPDEKPVVFRRENGRGKKIYRVGLSGNPGVRLTAWNAGLVKGGPNKDELQATLDVWKHSHVTKRYHAWQPSYRVRQPTQAEWDRWMGNQNTFAEEVTGGYQFDTFWVNSSAEETRLKAERLAKEQHEEARRKKRLATYYRELGRVKLFRELSNGRVWIESKRQRVLVDIVDLNENP